MPIYYDPLNLAAEPYSLYRQLRANYPVYHGETVGRRFWAISRYPDIECALGDWETFSSAQGNDLDDCGELFGSEPALDLADPPIHTRQQAVMRAVMTAPRFQQALGPLISAKIDRILDEARARDVVDIADLLAYPLPMETICSWIGYPENDFPALRSLHERMLIREAGCASLPADALAARDSMWDYVRAAIAERVARPRGDMLSVIAEAQRNGALTPGEALANSIFLFDAGIVSSSALISSSLLNLVQWPQEKRLLWGDPETYLSRAIEEFLRFEPPFQWFTRVTTRSVNIAGTPIPKGARVVLVWGSGNRCESQWEDGEDFRITRPRKRHLTFGGGIHLCLGAPLARLEMALLYRALVRRVVDFEQAGPVTRRITPSERTISSLPMRITWRD